MGTGKYSAAVAAALAMAVVLGLAGCSQQPSVAGPPPAAADPEVGVVEIQPRRVAITTELAGRTAPYAIAEIRPQVGGIIQKRPFREGGDVKAGELLYQLDPATYQAAVDSAKAALARSRANLVPARLKAERYRELVKANAISRQDHDDADAAWKQAEAGVAADAAALEAARINLAYTRVTSPIPGRVGRSAVTQGALVTAGQAAVLATVQQLDPIYVDVTQSSAELLRLRRALAGGRLKRANGAQAKVRLLYEDGSPYPLEGSLQFSEATVDQSTGAVTLRAVFPNPKHDLLPGMYVRAVLEEGVDEQAILAPQQGVARDPKGNATAMVVVEGGTVEARALRIDRALGEAWLVSDGLKQGDLVIVEGLQKVRPGVKVKVVQAPAGTGSSGAPGSKAAGQ
jgi:membrane fusion protein (multidrug efflux system)